MIRVSLIDDEILFLKGLKELLDKESMIQVVEVFHHSDQLITAWENNEHVPDILLVDMEMPGLNGIELTKYVSENFTKVKIIGLSSHYSKVLIFEMLKLGASGYLAKDTPFEKLVHNIREVHKRGFYSEDIILKSYNEGTLRPKDEKDTLNHGLSNREIEVLQLICEQLTNNEIAEKLFISLKTVERHRSNLFEKTRAKNIVGVVFFALEKKLIKRIINH